MARIWRIEVDSQCRWPVSSARDKTVKVWGLADTVRARTLRVPRGAGNLSKVCAVAIAPGGARAATAVT